MLGEAGQQLAQSFRSWGDEPLLQKLNLTDCSISLDSLLELLQCMSKCMYLTELCLRKNRLGEAGIQLAQSIKSRGRVSPLQELYLENCSFQTNVSIELLQSLSTCSQLRVLALDDNKLGEAGYQLAHSIRSWGDNPSLSTLYLYNCSMHDKVSEELLKSLSTCKYLAYLDLGRNNLQTAGHQLVSLIRSLGHSPQLKELKLNNCNFTMDVSSTLLQALSTCRKLTILDLSMNVLGEAGHHLAESIRNWKNDPPLQKLYLRGTFMPMNKWNDILQSLTMCHQLTFFDAPEDVLAENGYCLQICGSTDDNRLLEPNVRNLFSLIRFTFINYILFQAKVCYFKF